MHSQTRARQAVLVRLGLATLSISAAHAQAPSGIAPGQAGAAASAPALAPNASQAEERARIETLLTGYHGLPPQALLFSAAKDPAAQLREIAGDPEVFRPKRDAALEALMIWPDAETLAVYRAALSPSRAAGTRHKATRYLALAYGEAAFDDLVRLLADADPEVRRTAALAMSGLPQRSPGGAQGEPAPIVARVRSALTEALKTESDPVVRADLIRLLAQLDPLR